MKRVLYALTGFAWGIFFLNKEIMIYAILITFIAVGIDIMTSNEK